MVFKITIAKNPDTVKDDIDIESTKDNSYNFIFQLEDFTLFKNIIECFSRINAIGYFLLSRKGIKIISSDDNSKVFLHFYLSNQSFEKFDCQNEFSMEINFCSLFSILQRTFFGNKRNSKLTKKIELSYKHSDTLEIKIIKEIPNKRLSDATNKHNHSFTLKIESLMYGKNLIDFLHSNYQLFKKNIKTVYYAHFSLDSYILLDTIKDIKALSDKFSLQITKELVRFDIKNLYYDEITQEDLHTLNCKEPQLEEYPINCLGRIFLKFYKYTEVLKFFLRTGKSLKLKFQFPNHSYLKCYLAPIKEEQENFEYEEYNTTYFYPESSNKITKIPRVSGSNISRLKRKFKKPIPDDPEQFLNTFKDNRERRGKSAQTNFTSSGNTINSKVRSKFIKGQVRERKGKKKNKKLSDKEFRKSQLNSIKKLGD